MSDLSSSLTALNARSTVLQNPPNKVNYEDSPLKEQADDIISRFVIPMERHVAALEEIARSAEAQAKSAEIRAQTLSEMVLSLREQTSSLKSELAVHNASMMAELSIHKKDLELNQEVANDARADSAKAYRMSWFSIFFSAIAALIAALDLISRLLY